SAYALGFALGVCFYLGASREKAIAAIENAQSLEGRGRILTLPTGITLIDDSYNANPSSLSASLSAASSISAGRRFAVIGEMLELGKSGVDFHEKILPMLSPFDKVWLVGNMWKEVSKNVSLSENLVLWNDVPKLGVFLSGELRKGDVLLVKGSHGNRLDRIVSFLAGRNLR
ncbi:MAG: cyanophycin synthetase, partial [Synergistaceae bacterium]|nr:cyanophycin synthetase [Synergistaceae bacterium]